MVLVADLSDELGAEFLRPLVGLVDVVDMDGRTTRYGPDDAVRPANSS